MTTTASFIAGFEGYAGRAYWDVNAWRLGYGSDTEGPDQIHVTEGMETTKARALQNLSLRIPQFQTEAVYGKTGMGRDTWDKLNENQQSAITSLVYNYGRLPIVVTPSDPEKTASAIRALQNANGGVNRKRRIAEAAFYLTPDAATVPQPKAPEAVPQVPAPSVPGPLSPLPTAPARAEVPGPPPAGLPPILSTSAGRIAAQLDSLMAMRAARIAELVAADPEIAAYEAAAGALAKFGSASAIVPPPLLQKPASEQEVAAMPQPQGLQTMLGTNWITSLFGTGSIAGAVATVGVDLYNKQIPDAASMSLIFSSVMAGMGLIQAKDKAVTGGTIPQTIEAQPRATSPTLAK